MQLSFSVFRNLLPPSCSQNKEISLKNKKNKKHFRNTTVTNLFAGDSLLTFILEFFFGWKPVPSSTHPFRGERRGGTIWSWAHLTLRHRENWLICVMSEIRRYQNIQMTQWRRDWDRCHCRRRRREAKNRKWKQAALLLLFLFSYSVRVEEKNLLPERFFFQEERWK